MGTVELRKELKGLIEKENDRSILEAIKTLLKKTRPDSTLKDKLTSRAAKSEEDITAGRVMDRQEFEQKLNGRLGI